MSRKRSSGSRHGPISTIDSWQRDNVEPFNGFTLKQDRPPKMQRTGSAYPSIAAGDHGDFSHFLDNAQSCLLPGGLSKQRVRQNNYRPSTSPRQAKPLNPFSPQSPSIPSMGELTNATTPTSVDMSQQSSHVGSSVCGALEMLRMSSQISAFSSSSVAEENSPLDEKFLFSSADESKFCLSDVDRSHYIDYAGGVVDDAHSHSSDGHVYESHGRTSIPKEEKSVQRSNSTESNTSNQSRASRRSLKDVNHSARLIQPKIHSEVALPRELSSSPHRIFRINSDDGSSKVVASIPKTPYVRPTHEKVKCELCDEHPQGFRGDHELRRHHDRKHSELRKVYICRDISENKKFLASCKACNRGKQYNAYYNAGAHLRRAHFNPKHKDCKGKRGAKSGGDQPPMEILRNWMEERYVPVPSAHKEAGHAAKRNHSDVANAPLSLQSSPPEFDTRSDLEFSSVPTANLGFSDINHYVSPPAPLPFSAPIRSQHYDSSSLQPTTTISDCSDLFDLSHGTSINATSIDDFGINDPSVNEPSIADPHDLFFNMDISVEDMSFL